MEKLKQLIQKFYDYTITISITESELFENYHDKLSETEREYLDSKNDLDNEIERMIKADILYDFLYTPVNIIDQIKTDISCFEKDSEEYKYIKEIYEEIKKVFLKFKIEELEEVD